MSNAKTPTTHQAIIAIDQGTTSSRAILFNQHGEQLHSYQQEFTQHFPQSGWVEHDPQDILNTSLIATKTVMEYAQANSIEVLAVGITNQRETTLVWHKETGEPVYNAIVWQDRRTSAFCAENQEYAECINAKTGLLLDPYFSASKIAWILNNVEGARAQAENGELIFGTVDTFLIWHLTAGKVHATDTTNASRTNLFNIHTLDWDSELLEWYDIPAKMLPEVKESADHYGMTSTTALPLNVPIAGVAGDQQAALFGQCCFTPGGFKATYGTGCFALLNTGTEPQKSNHQMLTTVGYTLHGETYYALEGSIFTAGANIQWLRDGIKVIKSASATKALAESLEYDHGVVLVPGFAGLGAPHWEADARAAIYGMSRGTSEAHFARAALEAVCYQTYDLLTAMSADSVSAKAVWVDGGMVGNDWLCQFLADILQVAVLRPKTMESTALGVMYLAGLQVGWYKDTQSLQQYKVVDKKFTPQLDDTTRSMLLTQWQKAVAATLAFI